jgi:hypothetical protein
MLFASDGGVTIAVAAWNIGINGGALLDSGDVSANAGSDREMIAGGTTVTADGTTQTITISLYGTHVPPGTGTGNSHFTSSSFVAESFAK